MVYIYSIAYKTFTSLIWREKQPDPKAEDVDVVIAHGSGDHHGDTERSVKADFGSTPAMIENAIASGISASATSRSAMREGSQRRLS
jgi:hypothetical protein